MVSNKTRSKGHLSQSRKGNPKILVLKPRKGFIRVHLWLNAVYERKALDMGDDFIYIHSMFTSATVNLLATRKAAWHISAVAGGGFY